MKSFLLGLTTCGECGAPVSFDVGDALAGWAIEECPQCRSWVLVTGWPQEPSHREAG